MEQDQRREGKCKKNVPFEFSSVFAEPKANQGFKQVWKLNKLMFTQTKLLVLGILSVLISVPLAIVWALVFSLVTLYYVWLIKPCLSLLTVCCAKRETGPSCNDNYTSERAENRELTALSDKVNNELSFVFAEECDKHGFNAIWKINYIIFTQTKLWVYKILSALISIPLAILWALVFSLVILVYIWVVKPVIALFSVFFAITKKFITSIVDIRKHFNKAKSVVTNVVGAFKKPGATEQADVEGQPDEGQPAEDIEFEDD